MPKPRAWIPKCPDCGRNLPRFLGDANVRGYLGSAFCTLACAYKFACRWEPFIAEKHHYVRGTGRYAGGAA